MTSRIAKIAAAGALTAVIAGAGTQAFAADRTGNALIGAAVGALAGSLVSHGDTGGVIAGAAVGGLIGAAATNDHRRYYGERSYRTYDLRRSDYAAYPAYGAYDRGYAYRDYDAGYAPRWDYQPARYRGW